MYLVNIIIDYFLISINYKIEFYLPLNIVERRNFMIYENVKKLADKKGLTIAEVERKANLQNGAISKWKDSMPRVDNIKNVAEVLGCRIEFLLKGI